MIGVRVLIVFALALGAAGAQEFGIVCSTDVPDATGPNNGHKLACRTEMVGGGGEEVTLVFQSSQGINLCLYQTGWLPPVFLYPGSNPAIDFGGDSDRHLVWRMLDTVTGRYCAYYRNLEYRMVPLNVSEEGGVRELDVWADDSGLAHVVWSQGFDNGTQRIAYRTCSENGVVGGRFWVSEETTAVCRNPSIECYDDGISVVWQRDDSARPVPYSIMRRKQSGGVWGPQGTLFEDTLPVEHPSQDMNNDDFEAMSGGWDWRSPGNSEVYFHAGNGGGYPTPGTSTAPVLTTMSWVWSYLFWQEESNGDEDICCHFWYGFPRSWYEDRPLRQILGINENIRAPSCLGAMLVWTQGDSAPYKVMWSLFGYPIPIQEAMNDERGRMKVGPTIVRGVLFLGAGKRGQSTTGQSLVLLLDAAGRKVMELRPGANDARHLSPGVYFVRTANSEGRAANTKVVIQR
ncbi:hypothetical protein FJY71_06075 [candidate division WOR-3 bacterium]|nr:hypothetical protein [candidate division WOR-3 bacterium]